MKSLAFTQEKNVWDCRNCQLVHQLKYLEFVLGRNIHFDMLVIIKLTFHRTILQVRDFVNRLEQAPITLTNRNTFVKCLFLPFGKFYFSFVNLTRSRILKLTRPWGPICQTENIFEGFTLLGGILWNEQNCCNLLKVYLWSPSNVIAIFVKYLNALVFSYL